MLDHNDDCIGHRDTDELETLFKIPLTMGCDFAEEMALFPCLGYGCNRPALGNNPKDSLNSLLLKGYSNGNEETPVLKSRTR